MKDELRVRMDFAGVARADFIPVRVPSPRGRGSRRGNVADARRGADWQSALPGVLIDAGARLEGNPGRGMLSALMARGGRERPRYSCEGLRPDGAINILPQTVRGPTGIPGVCSSRGRGRRSQGLWL